MSGVSGSSRKRGSLLSADSGYGSLVGRSTGSGVHGGTHSAQFDGNRVLGSGHEIHYGDVHHISNNYYNPPPAQAPQMPYQLLGAQKIPQNISPYNSPLISHAQNQMVPFQAPDPLAKYRKRESIHEDELLIPNQRYQLERRDEKRDEGLQALDQLDQTHQNLFNEWKAGYSEPSETINQCQDIVKALNALSTKHGDRPEMRFLFANSKYLQALCHYKRARPGKKGYWENINKGLGKLETALEALIELQENLKITPRLRKETIELSYLVMTDRLAIHRKSCEQAELEMRNAATMCLPNGGLGQIEMDTSIR